MDSTRSKRVSRALLESRLRARRVVLRDVSERMIAAIRVHVAGCPHCELKVCADGMREILSGVDERLAISAARADARRAKAARSPGKRRSTRAPKARR